MANTYSAGIATAYGAAVRGGYSGTYDDFCRQQAEYAESAAAVEQAKEDAEAAATAAEASKTAAASSATNAAGSASAAATSEGQASTSATNAANSATAANASKTAAATSATEAENAATSAAGSAATAQGVLESIPPSYDDLADEVADLKEDFTDLPDYGYVPTAGQMVSDNVTVDTEPYSFRATPYGDREIVDGIVGGTVAFNQLVGDFIPVGTTSTTNGVSITHNSDGSFTLDGTATENGNLPLTTVNIYPLGRKLMLTGYLNKQNTYLGIAGIPVDRGNGGILNNTYASTYLNARIEFSSGVEFNNDKIYPQFHDLTKMFGSAVADAIYALEQAHTGDGVTYLKAVAPKMFAQYNPYNEGELMSVSGLSAHETVGFNAWDEEWEVGGYNASTGAKSATTSQIRCKNLIPILPSTTYYANFPSGYAMNAICFYDASKTFISATYLSASGTKTTPSDAYYMAFQMNDAYGTTYNHDIYINISDPTRNGQYEPYVKHSYALDDSLTLMGVPKWVDGKLKFDGDVYLPNGGVQRRYGIVDMGTLNWQYHAQGSGHYFGIPKTALEKEPKACVDTAIAKIVCAKYIADTSVHVYVDQIDKTIGVYSNGSIVVQDSAYTDAASFKTAMSGVYLVYELATPTTETAEPYQSVQVCPNGGTEEYVSTSIVPVGHTTDYPANLRDKLQHLPDLASADGNYIVSQSGTQMTLAPLPIVIPAPPTTDGTYTFRATVSNGVPTLSWVAE